MPAAPVPRDAVLHHVRLKGFATLEGLAEETGLSIDDAGAALAAIEAAGLAENRTGRVPGYRLTAAGRDAQTQAAAAELGDPAVAAAIDGWYRAFLTLNPELVATCTAWQVRGTTADAVLGGAALQLNDHADAGYDAAVTDRLERVHARALPVCTGLTAQLPRFGRYAPRLATALDKVRAGRTEWFAAPLIDSYHTVWMELHEDLLVTLRIERSDEAASRTS